MATVTAVEAGPARAPASVQVNGYVYGIDGMGEWIDRQGTPVEGPDNGSWRQVLWVDCRA